MYMAGGRVATVQRIPAAGSSFVRRYGIGLLAAAGSTAVRVALMPLLGTRPPYITFYLGTVVAAAFGGMGPGLTVVFIGTVFGLVVLPGGPVDIAQEATRLVLFILSGFGICLVAEGMHRQSRRVQEQAQDLERVVRMLDLANVFVRDSSDRITRWNSGCCRLYGYTAEETVGRVSHDLLGTRFPEPLDVIRRKVLAEGSWQGELSHTAADGREVVVTSNWILQREGSGDDFSILEVNTDITGRKRAEETLKEERAKLVAVVETLDVGVMITDGTGTVLSMNPAARRLYGFAPSAEMPIPHEEFQRRFELRDLDGRLLSLEERPLGRALYGDFFDHLELSVRNVKTGREWIGSWSAAPVRDSEGEIQLLVFTVHDITQGKRAEAVLQRAKDELELLVRQRTEELRGKELLLEQQSRQAAMGEMVNNIAHQWRQPLNSLGLMVQSFPMLFKSGELSYEGLQEKAKKAMEIIRHMSQTIDDFRDYFKPEKERVPFRATEVVSKAMKLTQDHFKTLNIEMEVNAPADPVIVGYPNQFGQVLLNILLNARDAVVERKVPAPKISITIKAENGNAVITIGDNAGGIPDDILPNIFEPYFTTKGPEHGTGIGLYMSKTIIEKNMAGKLAGYNTEEGAEFRIEVTASAEE